MKTIPICKDGMVKVINSAVKTLLLLTILSFNHSVLVAQTPTDFPGEGINSSISWIDYTLADGSLIQDPTSDVSPSETDVVFTNPGDPSSVAFAFDGLNAFFRLQIKDNPIKNGSINSSFGAYIVELAAPDAVGESDYKVLIGVDGKSQTDRVYMTNQDGSIETTVYSESGFRTRPVPGSSPASYYIEWQVPILSIANIWPGFNSTTPMKMFMGTSTTLQSIVKDYMVGSEVDFTIVSLAELESSGNNVLPVELVSFTADVFNKNIYLKWETATELNNFGFSVEKSICNDSSTDNWTEIAFVDGAGNSSSPKFYSHTDKYNQGKVLKYRLKQIDFNGQYSYSDVIELEFNDLPEEPTLQNFPNPFNPVTSIQYSIPSSLSGQDATQLVTLKVFDILGNEVATLINENQPSGNYSVEFNASNISSGIYIYMLQTEKGFTLSRKLTLVK